MTCFDCVQKPAPETLNDIRDSFRGSDDEFIKLFAHRLIRVECVDGKWVARRADES